MSKDTSQDADFIGSRKLQHPEKIQRFMVTSKADETGNANYAIAVQVDASVLEITINEDEFACCVRLFNQAWEQVNHCPLFD